MKLLKLFERIMMEESTPDALRELIVQRRGGRSNQMLSDDCGGTIGSSRLQQMATGRIRNFPDPDTIRGLAMGLGVSEHMVLAAAAESLGLRMRPASGGSDLVIPGAGRLPDSAVELLRAMALEMLELHAHPAPAS